MSKSPTSQTEREFIEYRFNEVMKRLDRMEQTMNGFAFVKQSDFDEFKRDTKEIFATKEEITPIKRVFYGIMGATSIGFVGLLFWLVQWLIQKAGS